MNLYEEYSKLYSAFIGYGLDAFSGVMFYWNQVAVCVCAVNERHGSTKTVAAIFGRMPSVCMVCLYMCVPRYGVARPHQECVPMAVAAARSRVCVPKLFIGQTNDQFCVFYILSSVLLFLFVHTITFIAFPLCLFPFIFWAWNKTEEK